MASDVDICNLMLSRLGDDATITSLSPPEGSVQAERCATFYPLARDSLLELYDWNFATRRVVLTETTLPIGCTWQYAYIMPNNVIRVISVLPPEVSDDYSVTLGNIPGYRSYGYGDYEAPGFIKKAYYTPQDFAIETVLSTGELIILTNQPQANARITFRVTDTTKFSPLFTDTLGWYGAHMLAGPILKGDVGAAEGKRCLQFAMALLGKASVSDARQEQIRPMQNVPWIGNR